MIQNYIVIFVNLFRLIMPDHMYEPPRRPRRNDRSNRETRVHILQSYQILKKKNANYQNNKTSNMKFI